MGPGEATVVARSSSREMHVSPLTSHGLLREAQQHVPNRKREAEREGVRRQRGGIAFCLRFGRDSV